MKIEPIPVRKNDKRGIILSCGKTHYLARHKGTLSADHTHEDYEIIYLVRGKIELTIGVEKEIIQAPVYFELQPNEYHKILALTDIELIYNRAKDDYSAANITS